MRFGSLFTGIGGFDLGFERAGMICAWQVEKDKFCNQVLRHHWPEVRRYDDIQTITGESLPCVDILCGGFPCQDISVAGVGRGLAGKRSGLFYEFIRLLSAVRPTWAVFENVPGLLSSHDGRDMGVVIGALADIGYLGAWRVFDSRYFGVPQRRRRVFLVGYRGDGSRAAEILFEPAGLPRNSPPHGIEGTGQITGTLTACAHKRSGHDNAARGLLVVTDFGVRNLTPRECERLQGFPDDWTRYGIDGAGEPVGISDTRRYKQLGNAVTVPVAEWIGRRITEAVRQADLFLSGPHLSEEPWPPA